MNNKSILGAVCICLSVVSLKKSRITSKNACRIISHIWVALFFLSWAEMSLAIPIDPGGIRYEGVIDFVNASNGLIDINDYFIGEFTYSEDRVSAVGTTQKYNTFDNAVGIGSNFTGALDALRSTTQTDDNFFKLPGAIIGDGSFGSGDDLSRGAVEISNDDPNAPVLTDSFLMRNNAAKLYTFLGKDNRGTVINPSIPVIYGFQLRDYEANVFNDSDAKSATFLEDHFDAFDFARFTVFFNSGGVDFVASGDIRAISVPVPEPTSLALMVIGLAGIGLIRRRKTT